MSAEVVPLNVWCLQHVQDNTTTSGVRYEITTWPPLGQWWLGGPYYPVHYYPWAAPVQDHQPCPNCGRCPTCGNVPKKEEK